jgi:hypothetical protein
VQHVNNAGEGVWVVLHLFKQGWGCLIHPVTCTQCTCKCQILSLL